jgi:methionyl-tRNA formyltransferase
MFDTIILLTGRVEQATMALLLWDHNPSLRIVSIGSADDLANLNTDILPRARLIAFVTSVIVPQRILGRLGYGAFNFHPGPPRYPGWAPSHFALYEQATEFGATVHVMVEQVDAGPIIDVAPFRVPAGISVFGLERMTYARLAQLFRRMSRRLASDPEPPPVLPVRWGSRTYSRRSFGQLCDIPGDLPKDEFEHRMRIFGGKRLEFALRSSCTTHNPDLVS